MLILELRGKPIPMREPARARDHLVRREANQLSPETIAYPWIEAIHDTTKPTFNHTRGTGPYWLGRNQTASSGIIDTHLWRGGYESGVRHSTS